MWNSMVIGSLHKWSHPYGVAGQKHQELRKLKLIETGHFHWYCLCTYLHCGCGSTIIHGDLKPSSICLDDEITAHVGDFGLEKIISASSNDVSQSQSDSIAIWGTIGYAAPSTKSLQFL